MFVMVVGEWKKCIDSSGRIEYKLYREFEKLSCATVIRTSSVSCAQQEFLSSVYEYSTRPREVGNRINTRQKVCTSLKEAGEWCTSVLDIQVVKTL